MGINRNISLISALFIVVGLVACGGGAPQPTQAELNQFWAASSLKTQLGGGGSVSDPGNSNIVSNDTPAKQVIVGGTVAGEASGAVTISVHETEPCAKGYCPIETKGPLASTQISTPGYFSVVVPSRGEKLTVVAKSGALSGMHYLGELSTRVDGIEITLE
jgi:hypothetical protein